MKSILLIYAFIGLTFAIPKVDAIQKQNIVENLLFQTKFKKPIDKMVPTMRGDLLDPHALPYMVLMQVTGLGDEWYCGGTLISQNYVVTSASCTAGVRQAIVMLGAHFVHRDEAGKIILTSNEIIPHEEYRNYTNDIAVVKLPQTIEYSNTIQPVLLPKKSDVNTNYQGVIARLSGWGADTWGDENIFEIPRYAFAEVLSNSDSICEDLAKPLPDTVLCTSGTYEGKYVGPAIGDEGGPLVLNGVLIGVISFGYVYWFTGEPAAHTRVASYLDWLEAHTDVVIN